MDRVVNKKLIAVIPARSGSKRIPRKNMIEFCGKPMIAWTIEAARATNHFDRIIVSTDDQGIADLAVTHGAEAPFLRPNLFEDRAPVAEATLTAVSQAASHWDETYETVVQLMATCPLRGAEDITGALDRFDREGASFLVSCCKYGWLNPWWAHKVDAGGHPQRLFADAIDRRSQDLEVLYCPTGAIWIAKLDALQASKTFYGPGHIFHPLDWTSSIDIDDPSDLEMAKMIGAARSPSPALGA